MAKKDINLSRLKEEIEGRKQNKKQVSADKGQPVDGTNPKDAFLNELLISLKSGKPSRSTDMIKLVEQKTAIKTGEAAPGSATQTVSQTVATHNKPQTYAPNPAEDQEREGLLLEEMERRKKELRSQGLMPPEQQGLTEVAPGSLGVTLNEEYLNEVVLNSINENVAHIVEQAMRDTIVEIYVGERMKEVLMENEDIIKSVVIKTIRDLQKKKNTK